DAIFVHDAETGAILDANEMALTLYGYTAEEMRRLNVEKLSSGEAPYTQTDALRYLQAARQGMPQVFEWHAQRRDGTRFWVEVSLKHVVFGNREYLLAVVRDITARKEADQLLDEARQRVLQAEVEKKRFYREVVLAVTNGKLHLVDPSDIPAEGDVLAEMCLDGAVSARALRARLRELAGHAGLSDEATHDLLLAASEAATNAVKHAHGGSCVIRRTADRLIVRVSDHGGGIRAEDLPGAVLSPGFSTEVSLGMGYTLMLHLTDTVWLSTGPEGTVVQIEKLLQAVERPVPPVVAWQRL
ncbi:MAG: PAS domain S-box protein, partial [Armatimonadota bacterium]|nr:PAS domain S-box protein [Armatimonadota bacterium]